MIRITLFVGISFIFFRCQSDTYEFDMDKAVKNLSLSKTSLTRFNYAGILNDPENIFSTPVLVDSGHDSVYIQDAIVKGAKCEISEEIKFLLTTVDHNRNYSLDPNDLIVISGVEDDSIMTVLNPLSVKGKNSILVKFDDQVLRVTVELKESKVGDCKLNSV